MMAVSGGNVTSNKPGVAERAARARYVAGGTPGRMWGAGPARSDGNRTANDPGHGRHGAPPPNIQSGSNERKMSGAGPQRGFGNVRSNEPSVPAGPEPTANVHSEGNSGTRRMSGTAPVPSEGEVHSAKPGPASEMVTIRRIAAKGVEGKVTSDGNREAVAPAPQPLAEAETGGAKMKAPPPARVLADRNRAPVEGVPPFAKEPLAGDGWTRARAKTKEMFAARR